MSRFLQLHLLTFYPPSNVNRDDTGRPKTAQMGGALRLRISSQALKRAWRTSHVFKTALEGHMGERTQRLGVAIAAHIEGRVGRDRAIEIARKILPLFGAPEDATDKNPLFVKQLAFIAPEERAAALALADQLVSGAKVDPADKTSVLRHTDTAADIAMFGRMLADSPDYNREAAVQVAHAVTTHGTAVEDDYYTAVDDLKRPAEDAGAGFIGEAGYGSGVFYLYICINRELLVRNLGGDADLANTAIAALVEAAATVTPSGKQNSFAAHARAGYILAERGDGQPRTLAGAFARPARGADLGRASIKALQDFRSRMDGVYGKTAETDLECDVLADGGPIRSLADIIAFCRA